MEIRIADRNLLNAISRLVTDRFEQLRGALFPGGRKKRRRASAACEIEEAPISKKRTVARVEDSLGPPENPLKRDVRKRPGARGACLLSRLPVSDTMGSFCSRYNCYVE